MDNTQNQATSEQIEKAKLLLLQAALQSPNTRLMAETVIQTSSAEGIAQLIVLLEKRVKEREEAYKIYKGEVAQLLTQRLPAKVG